MGSFRSNLIPIQRYTIGLPYALKCFKYEFHLLKNVAIAEKNTYIMLKSKDITSKVLTSYL